MVEWLGEKKALWNRKANKMLQTVALIFAKQDTSASMGLREKYLLGFIAKIQMAKNKVAQSSRGPPIG